MTWTKQTSTSTAFSKQNPTSTTWGIRRSGRYKYGDRLKFAGDPSGARYPYGGDGYANWSKITLPSTTWT